MKNIIVEKRNRIGIVTVNRPNELNSMNSETRKELAIAFEELDLDAVSYTHLTLPTKA